MSCVTFVHIASYIHSICFTLKQWANSSPCFKASPLDWKSVKLCSFTFFNMTFNFSTIPLCSLMDKCSFLPSLGFSWFGQLVPGIEKSLPLFEQPSAVRKVASFVQTKKMPMRGQVPHVQGELWLGDPKLTSLSFDLCFLINSSLLYWKL